MPLYSTLHLLGGIIFGAYFLWSGIKHFLYVDSMISYSNHKKVPNAKLAVHVAGVLLVLGGLGIILGALGLVSYVVVQWSAIFLVIFLIPVTLKMHDFWNETDPQMKMNEGIQFSKNVALLGAVLMMF